MVRKCSSELDEHGENEIAWVDCFDVTTVLGRERDKKETWTRLFTPMPFVFYFFVLRRREGWLVCPVYEYGPRSGERWGQVVRCGGGREFGGLKQGRVY